MALHGPIDRFLLGAMTRGWPRERFHDYVESLKVDDEQSALPNVIGRSFQIVDAKATGLLTHTSMMVAALGVTAPVVAESRIEQGVIIVEIMLYLLVAIACLRCIAVLNEHAVAHDPSRVADAVRDELILRRELFMLCTRAAIYLTVLIFISLPILYLYVPHAPAMP
jgi:hypothetical protein